MTDGDKLWKREHREIEDCMAGRGTRSINKRDPVALAIGLINLLAIIGGWAWYGGRLDQRVTSLEDARREDIEAQRGKVNLDAVQTVQITELQRDVKYMRETLDRIDRKIPERTR